MWVFILRLENLILDLANLEEILRDTKINDMLCSRFRQTELHLLATSPKHCSQQRTGRVVVGGITSVGGQSRPGWVFHWLWPSATSQGPGSHILDLQEARWGPFPQCHLEIIATVKKCIYLTKWACLLLCFLYGGLDVMGTHYNLKRGRTDSTAKWPSPF